MPEGHPIQHWIRNVFQPHRILSLFFLAIILTLFLYFYQDASPRPPIREAAGTPANGTIEVFFSAPDDPAFKTLRGGPDANLAASIAAAQHSVDVAAYNLDLWSIRDAILEAQRSGARVRLVVEDGNIEQPEIQDLIGAGIAVVTDGQRALMHHKFVVVDQWHVWTGSMNFTLNGAYRNDNNLLHLQSSRLAKDYVREFEEMYVEGRFGQLSRWDTPFPIIEVDGTRLEVYFSPDDDPLLGILKALGEAREQVLVMAYTLTSDEIAALLLEKSQEGLDVRVVMEADQVRSTGNDFTRLQEAGVDALLDGNPYNMHHKVIIIDGEIVITGSYNFTRSAEERNDENLIIIRDEELAQEYLVEFTRIWETAQR